MLRFGPTWRAGPSSVRSTRHAVVDGFRCIPVFLLDKTPEMKRTSTLEPPMTGLVFLYFGQTTGDTPSGQAVRTSHEEQPLYENSEIHLFVYLDAIAYHYNASSSLFAFSFFPRDYSAALV